jgi:hypothetical protein
MAIPELVPDGRALFIGPEGKGFRFWMLSQAAASVADEALRALDAGDEAALEEALARARLATVRLRELGHTGLVRGGSAAIAFEEDRVRLLAIEEIGEQADRVAPDDHALSVATAYAADEEPRRACLARALARVPKGG